MHEYENENDHEHFPGPLGELVTLRDWLRYAVTRFNREGLYFGHGCTDAYDEAAWLLLHTMSLPLDRLEPFLDAGLMQDERVQLLEIIDRRVNERIPTAYLTGEAWLGDFRFHVDERVIVPRSFFAELLGEGLEPWIDDGTQINRALDLCTGSGCLAILMAHVFPNSEIVAADLSTDALAVAQQNVDEYGLNDRIQLVQSDVYDSLGDQRFDLIIANPPYVTADSMSTLPAEYLHEPQMALAAGDDGLDVVRRILDGAKSLLTPNGVIAVEVGHNKALVERAFPHLPFIWLATTLTEAPVFLLKAEDLS